MTGKKRSASSSRWLQEHFSDKYVQQAQKKGLRSRAWFKLDEIQQSDKIFKPGMTIVDLGAAPGGWSQYAVTQIGNTGRIIACDLLPMDPIVGVDFLQAARQGTRHVGTQDQQFRNAHGGDLIAVNLAIDLEG